MFHDGSPTQEMLTSQPPTPEKFRAVAVALIGVAVAPELPVTDDERQTARDIAQALGMIPTVSLRWRDPVSRQWKKAQ